MNEGEEYERVKREIGWHATGGDVAFFACVFALIALIVWLS